MKTKENRHASVKKSRGGRWIKIMFCLSFALYLGCRLGLNSYNAQMQLENQKLTSQISDAQGQIDELQIEINLLQEKTRVLGMLDYQVTDNQNNIYVIDNN